MKYKKIQLKVEFSIPFKDSEKLDDFQDNLSYLKDIIKDEIENNQFSTYDSKDGSYYTYPSKAKITNYKPKVE